MRDLQQQPATAAALAPAPATPAAVVFDPSAGRERAEKARTHPHHGNTHTERETRKKREFQTLPTPLKDLTS